jgi:hypothetical protein
MANLRNETFKSFARLVFAGLVAAGVVGGGIRLSEFNSAGKVNPNDKVSTIAADWLNVFVTATGSNTVKYPAACIANPLKDLGLGTGAIVRLSYSAGNNPAGVGGDIGFTKGCTDAYGSGQDIINNTCTSTGCTSFYTTGTALWNSADFIKLTLRADPTTGYTGRIRLQYEDVYGR